MLWLWLAACQFMSSGDLQTDLQRACKIAERVEADTSVDTSKKLADLIHKVADEQAGPAALALLQAIEQTPPKMRRKILKEALEQNGMAELKCPALERIVTQL
jgi:hypothetical protein